ncbi:MAG: phage tail protein [Clostridia bacterium]|nr:phage tail protein [Clostridia bacterium]
MAFSTYKSFLMLGSGTGTITYSKLVDIKSFGDLGGVPETIDVTTLSDKKRKTVPGVEDLETITFTANYTAADYDTVAAVAGTEKSFAVWFGGTESSGVVTPTGSDGKFEMTGVLSVYKNGGGVNEAQEMTISINASSGPTKASS